MCVMPESPIPPSGFRPEFRQSELSENIPIFRTGCLALRKRCGQPVFVSEVFFLLMKSGRAAEGGPVLRNVRSDEFGEWRFSAFTRGTFVGNREIFAAPARSGRRGTGAGASWGNGGNREPGFSLTPRKNMPRVKRSSSRGGAWRGKKGDVLGELPFQSGEEREDAGARGEQKGRGLSRGGAEGINETGEYVWGTAAAYSG